MTNEPTKQPTTKKRVLLEKLTYTSSHIYMVCGRGVEGCGTCTLEFAKVVIERYKKVYSNTVTNILLLRSWF
jgi:ferredoxin